MSARDDKDGARMGQAKSTSATLQRQAGEMALRATLAERIAVGVVYRSDIMLMFHVSDDTVREWEIRGLRRFNPATTEAMYRVEDLQKMLSKAETFTSSTRKKRKAARRP